MALVDDAAATARRDGGGAREHHARKGRGSLPPAWRERLVPKTVIGMSMLILAFSVGAALSGVGFYAYYQNRLDRNVADNRSFRDEFGQQFENAKETIEAETNNGRAAIQNELAPIKALQAGPETIARLQKSVVPSVWFVQTQDEAGAASVGSAFVVASDGRQSLLLTSFTTVRAATRNPGPQVVVRRGDEQERATLWTWQEDKDLALLIVPKGDLPKLAFAPANPPLRVGDRLFAVSGLGGSGGAVTQGFVADISSAGVMHDVAVGQAFQGGPLVSSEGKVVAIASRTYAPLGYRTDGVWFGIPPKAACERVLRCPGGDPSNADQGNRG